MQKPIILMGVSGCGKTTIGKNLSQRLGIPFIEGDEYHPSINIDKMSNGIPLNDDDRLPWLMKLRDLIHEHITRGESLVLSCSALKEKYRQILSEGNNIVFIYLRGSYDMIHSRMQKRMGHYMKPDLLKSQFDALEEPLDAITVDIDRDVDSIVQDVIDHLGID